MNDREAQIVSGMELPMVGDDRVQMTHTVLDDNGDDRSDEILCTQGDLLDAMDYLSDGLDWTPPDTDAKGWSDDHRWEVNDYVKEVVRFMRKAKQTLDGMQEVTVSSDLVPLEVIGRTFADGYEYMLVRR
jgi:hypothetical protein